MTLSSVSQAGPREPNYGLLGLTFFVGIYVPTGIVYFFAKDLSIRWGTRCVIDKDTERTLWRQDSIPPIGYRWRFTRRFFAKKDSAFFRNQEIVPAAMCISSPNQVETLNPH
jgi:hypothetical protein